MNDNKIYTGFKDYYLAIRRLPNGKFIIESKDKAFIEYYIGFTPFNTYVEASTRLIEIKTNHQLDRFSRNKAQVQEPILSSEKTNTIND